MTMTIGAVLINLFGLFIGIGCIGLSGNHRGRWLMRGFGVILIADCTLGLLVGLDIGSVLLGR